MVHQNCVCDLRIEIANVDLVVSTCIRSNCANDICQLVVVLLLRRWLHRCTPLVVHMSTLSLWLCTVLLPLGMRLRSCSWCCFSRFARSMRRPVEFETSLSSRDGCSVQTMIHVFRNLVVGKLDEAIAYKNKCLVFTYQLESL